MREWQLIIVEWDNTSVRKKTIQMEIITVEGKGMVEEENSLS